MKYSPGDRIESFRLLSECGSGSCGTVFLAENVVTGSRHAVKIISEGGGFSERELRGVVSYMRLCPRSDLMQITHAGRVPGGFYYVMDAAVVLTATAAVFVGHRLGGGGKDNVPAPEPSAPRIVTVREALAEAERLAAANAPSAEFARIRPTLDAERKRLFSERAEKKTAAFKRPVTKEDIERAARNPENRGASAEDFVRIGRSDAAAAAFDREHADDPVVNYFRAAQEVDAKLNTLRHLASLPRMEGVDMSAQLNDFAASLSRLKELEKRLILKYPAR